MRRKKKCGIEYAMQKLMDDKVDQRSHYFRVKGLFSILDWVKLIECDYMY